MLLDLLLEWIFLELTLAFLPPWCSLMSTDGSQEGRMRHGQVIKSDFEIIFMSGDVYMSYDIRDRGGIWVRGEEIFLRWNTSGEKILQTLHFCHILICKNTAVSRNKFSLPLLLYFSEVHLIPCFFIKLGMNAYFLI